MLIRHVWQLKKSVLLHTCSSLRLAFVDLSHLECCYDSMIIISSVFCEYSQRIETPEFVVTDVSIFKVLQQSLSFMGWLKVRLHVRQKESNFAVRCDFEFHFWR